MDNIMQKQDGERIGQFAQRLMVSTQLKNPAILEAISREFPQAKTTMACIAWYRSDLKKSKMAAPKQDEEVERTPEVIEAELEEAQKRVEELQAELDSIREAEAEKLLAEEEELKEKLKKINELKKNKAKEEKQEEQK
jgi:predicted RNase H-like nuclease (RuvC/YqgF family)